MKHTSTISVSVTFVCCQSINNCAAGNDKSTLVSNISKMSTFSSTNSTSESNLFFIALIFSCANISRLEFFCQICLSLLIGSKFFFFPGNSKSRLIYVCLVDETQTSFSFKDILMESLTLT